ncbi:MAG: FAD/NAD(P)-binding protein, partial [Microbacteriaceae bacterium]
MRHPIVVIGGGAAGVLAVSALLAEPGLDTEAGIVVVEAEETIGPGLAYGRAAPHHLLNSPAGRMSADAADPDDLLRWAAAQGVALGPLDFAPRPLYGRYLAERFRTLQDAAGGRLRSVRGTAVAVEPAGPVAVGSGVDGPAAAGSGVAGLVADGSDVAGADSAGPVGAGPVTDGPVAAGSVAEGLDAADPGTTGSDGGGPVAAGLVAAGLVATGSGVAGLVADGPVAAGPEIAGPEVAGPEVAGSEVAGSEVAGLAADDSVAHRLAVAEPVADGPVADGPGADRPDGALVRLADGRVIAARHVILAIGNPPPSGRAIVGRAPRTVVDPWAPGALLDTVRDGDRVLVVGSGLTAVDVVTRLARARPRAHFVVTSRRLLMPAAHPLEPRPAVPLEGDASTPGRLLRTVRAAVRATDAPWQSVADGIRPRVNAIWASWSLEQRRRFVEHISRRWEVLRHRMAPSVRAELDALIAEGRLELAAAPTGPMDVAVDCTGSVGVAAAGWSPLVDALGAAGLVRADALGIGLDTAVDGAAIGADGRRSTLISVLGPARRGSQWESTAVPEIREHALGIAARLAAAHPPARPAAPA